MLGLPDLEIGGDIRRIEVAKVDWSDPAAFHCSKPLDLILATDVVCLYVLEVPRHWTASESRSDT